MNSDQLHHKWLSGEISRSDVEAWLDYMIENNCPVRFDTLDVGHVADGIMSIYNFVTHGHPPGHFVSAVLRNDLVGAALSADRDNRQALWLYAAFLHHVAPGNWREWIEGGE